ncbi:MAG: hypothetical protein A2X48_01615 [Lentisphaerae bacterium GWF2_49_21]|nr:MAG: hypothetical protein A2X48_01615 [Lentisphaerae bacterium GWF2_49_21]
MKSKIRSALLLISALTVGVTAMAQEKNSQGAAEIAKWKDGKKAAFLLMFDDGMPSHLKNVIPELKQRGFIGTFYINPGVKWYEKSKWEKDVVAAGMVFGNHTMTHAGAKDAAQADADIAQCNEYVLKLNPELKQPRLISFSRPGGVDWKVTPDEMKAIFAKYNIVPRPPSNGRFGGIHIKNADGLLKVVDLAVEKGGSESLFFHGVGGDWLSQSTEDFVKMLDRLDANRDNLWITDPISMHKYETERNGAQVKVIGSDEKGIRISLSCSADANLYDFPLTLITKVPAAWKKCKITQSGKTVTTDAVNGQVQYDALPGKDEILIQPEE